MQNGTIRKNAPTFDAYQPYSKELEITVTKGIKELRRLKPDEGESRAKATRSHKGYQRTSETETRLQDDTSKGASQVTKGIKELRRLKLAYLYSQAALVCGHKGYQRTSETETYIISIERMN